MAGNKKAEFTIVASFDKLDKIIFIGNYLRYAMRIPLALVFNRSKYHRYLKKFKTLNEFKHNIYGHKALNFSLLRGFKKLNIPFLYNRVTKNTKYVILLWVDKKDLKKVQRIKQKHPNIKIATVPTACKYDYDLTWKFSEMDYIDFCCVASPWVKKSIENKVDKKYRNKFQSWPSGVSVPDSISDKTIHNAVLCYYKLVPEDKSITRYFQNMGIKTFILEYGKYDFDKYMDVLSKVDFVVFVQNIIETQGLSIAEAWAQNRPTIIKYNINDFGGETCPYLTNKTGLYYKNNKELFLIIDKYQNNPREFLKQFSPYKSVSKEFSDESSVKKLIKILQEKD